MSRHATFAFIAALSLTSPFAASVAEGKGDTTDARRATQALNILTAQGYAQDLQEKSLKGFLDFHAQGKDFAATISQNGHLYVVIVNPETGQVTRKE